MADEVVVFEVDGRFVDAWGNEHGDPDATDEYAEWTPAQLKQELKNRELPAGGKKADLIARLQENDKETPEDAEEEEEPEEEEEEE